jgi:hypothetical protein
MYGPWWSSAMTALALLSGPGACSKADCAGTCPKLGDDATENDVRLVLQTDTSFGFLVIDDDEFDIAIVGGELVIRSEEPGCVASLNHPCRAEIRRLDVRPSGFTTRDHQHVSDITLAVKAPFAVVDQGGGIFLAPDATVDSCVTVDGSKQHGTAALLGETSINFDDRPDTKTASLWGTWLIVFFDSEEDCRPRSASVTITATASSP